MRFVYRGFDQCELIKEYKEKVKEKVRNKRNPSE